MLDEPSVYEPIQMENLVFKTHSSYLVFSIVKYKKNQSVSVHYVSVTQTHPWTFYKMDSLNSLNSVTKIQQSKVFKLASACVADQGVTYKATKSHLIERIFKLTTIHGPYILSRILHYPTNTFHVKFTMWPP